MEGSAAAARLLLYVGCLVALGRGVVVFLDPAWKAGGRSVFDEPGPRWLARVAALALVVAPLLLLQGQLAALEMVRSDVPALLADTSWGRGWSVLTLASVLASAALMLPAAGGMALPQLLTAIGVAVAMGGLGHAAADEQWPVAARVLDALHMVAVGAWIGGLLVTLLVTRVPVFSLRDLAWRTFSRTATVAAPVAVLTGVLSGVRLLRSVNAGAVAVSDYGRLLALKSAFVLVVLAIGAAQRRRIARGVLPETARVWTEVGVAAAVLLVTAVLTGTEPPGE
ncbi:copper resistance D family protein [Gemmatimonas sp.]